MTIKKGKNQTNNAHIKLISKGIKVGINTNNPIITGI